LKARRKFLGLASKLVERKFESMQNRIEDEIDKTLSCMKDFDVRVSMGFADKLSRKIAKVRVCHTAGYRNPAFYTVAILLLLALNFVTGLTVLKGHLSREAGFNDVTVLANEYRLGQQGTSAF
jgi:hypothetical protein